MSVGWTYGAEHEWGDWNINGPLPAGCAHNKKDYTCVNSNGIANDPRGRDYGFGGEINTPPTDTIQGQVDLLTELKRAQPEAEVNYRSNLHLHVRVPGLRDDLSSVKSLQWYIHEWMPRLLDLIEPIPEPRKEQFHLPEDYEGARRRWRRRRVSHHTLLTPHRLSLQLGASTFERFWELEVPRSRRGRPLWHAQPRLCVNVRQLRETDTIEFRHFPGTLDERELHTALFWCREFLQAWRDGRSPLELYHDVFSVRTFPAFPEYQHWQEVRYRATCHDGTVPRATIQKNIDAILGGTFRP